MPSPAFNFKPSRVYLTLLTAILLISLGIIFYLSIPLWLKLSGFILVLMYGTHLIRHFGLLMSSHAIIGMTRHTAGHWNLHTLQHVYEAELRGDSTVTNLISILRFRLLHQRRLLSCVVLRDSMQSEDYRKLVMTLRMFK